MEDRQPHEDTKILYIRHWQHATKATKDTKLQIQVELVSTSRFKDTKLKQKLNWMGGNGQSVGYFNAGFTKLYKTPEKREMSWFLATMEMSRLERHSVAAGKHVVFKVGKVQYYFFKQLSFDSCSMLKLINGICITFNICMSF